MPVNVVADDLAGASRPTVPAVTAWSAVVVSVNAPKVPIPATDAAPATRATEAMTFVAVARRAGRVVLRIGFSLVWVPAGCRLAFSR